MPDRIVETSKFLSYVLRHRPDAIGIALDSEGWTDVDALIAAAMADGRRLDRALIEAVVAGNDKQRFTLSPDGMRIRAAQGHSTPSVRITYPPLTPPPLLYHGTASRFVAAIGRQGLRQGARQHVHLSQDYATALAVGARHGVPVVFEVDAAAMHAAGVPFFQADNGVWLTEAVAPRYLRRAKAGP